MAITPDVTTVTIDGITIGLSDTIGYLIDQGEFTVENLTPYMICGQLNKLCPIYASLTGAESTFDGNAGSMPSYFPNVNTGSLGPPTVEYAQNDNPNLPFEMYGRNILIYGSVDTSRPYINVSDISSTLRVVTSIDFKKIYYDVEMASESLSATKPNAKTFTFYKSGALGKVRTIDNDTDTTISIFSVVADAENGNWYCIIDDLFPGSDTDSKPWMRTSGQYISGAFENLYSSLNHGWSSYDNTKKLWRWAKPIDYEIYGGVGGDWGAAFTGYIDNGNNCYSYINYIPYYADMWCVPDGLEYALNQLANAGLKFKWNNTWYKPVGEGGYITGYTDDMSETSDWDDIEDVTGNTVPVTPPGPTPPGPGPYDDDPWNGASFSGVGVGGAGAFAKCYYMTSTELANLRSWMNSINVPEGFDPMQQIIGLSQVPVALSGSSPENVVFVNSSAVYDPGVTTRAVDTGVATQQAMGTPISYYLGSVDIVRRMQERGEPYLDYDCQIELYLPLIGMFSLDTQAVMGRTISAYAVLDPVSGTLAAYAYVSKDGQNLPVAYGSTTIGVDLPISAQQLSVSRAALKQANAQLGASLLSGALTMLAAASSGKASSTGAKTSTGSSGLSAAGIREAGSDYMKASQVGNVFGDFMNWGRTIRQLSYGNNTAVAGSFGGSTAQWAYPFTPYVKIIRPRFEKPSNYAHSQGVPCVQTKTIGSCTGFIQCIGADVSGISGATDLELQAIQAALSNGIYAGGGQ